MPLVLINNAWEVLRLILGCKINAGVGSKFCRMSPENMHILNIYLLYLLYVYIYIYIYI